MESGFYETPAKEAIADGRIIRAHFEDIVELYEQQKAAPDSVLYVTDGGEFIVPLGIDPVTGKPYYDQVPEL